MRDENKSEKWTWGSRAYCGNPYLVGRKMIFEDSIFIMAPAERVYAFFENMEENYLRWHPDHLCFEWRKGRGLEAGNIFYFEEKIAGQVLKKETRFTRIIPQRHIEFTMVNWFFRWFIPKMTFIMEPQEGGCVFTGQVILRGIGPLGKWLHRQEFAAVRQHMKEEGENLKKLLEDET